MCTESSCAQVDKFSFNFADSNTVWCTVYTYRHRTSDQPVDVTVLK
jgi:hypothetical protein